MEIQIPSPSVFLRDSPVQTNTPALAPEGTVAATANGMLLNGVMNAKQSKSRNGCTTCKKKRLKCDETKPSCVQCQKRNMVCAGYQKDYRWRSFEETKAKPKPTSREKSPRTHPSATKQNTNRTLNCVGASGNDGGASTPDPQFSGLEDFPLSSLWTSTPPSIPIVVARNCRDQQQSGGSSSRLHLEDIHDTHGALMVYPTHDVNSAVMSDDNEVVSPGVSFREHIDPYKYDASATESSITDTNGTTSPLLELLPPASPLPDPTSVLDDIEGTNGNPNEVFMGPEALSAHFTSDATVTWRGLRDSSPSPSIDSSYSSDSNDALIHTGPSLDASSPEMLMLRFDQQTCSILSVKDGPAENPWRTLIWPLARECPALYHAISSMTAFHGAHENPKLHMPGMAHMTKSMRRFASEMENMRLDYALATSLALAFSEVWESHVSTGVQHLRAAGVMVKNLMVKYRQDIRSGRVTSDEANRIRFLCNTYVYMDVVARLTSLEEASEIDFEEILATVNAPFEDEIEVDPLMGCAMTLFPLISRVANLMQRVYKTESNCLNSVSTAMELKEQIENWQVPIPVIYETSENSNSEVQHSIQTAEAYRYATLLCLHQAVPEIPSVSAQTLARKVLFKLASVPLSSGMIIVQIFPLFAASCEVTDPDDRTWVAQRWAAMTARLKLGNVKSCWGVVQEVWSRRDVFEDERANRLLKHYRPRGFPGETLVPSVMHMPPDLRRRVGVIDYADDNGVLYQSNAHEQSQHHLDRATVSVSGSWPPIVGKEFASKRRLLKRRVATNLPTRGLPTSVLASVSSSLNSSLRNTRVRRPLNDTTTSGQLEYEYTTRGQLHWLSVMAEWGWEVFL